jgi:hypothetical protein
LVVNLISEGSQERRRMDQVEEKLKIEIVAHRVVDEPLFSECIVGQLQVLIFLIKFKKDNNRTQHANAHINIQ